MPLFLFLFGRPSKLNNNRIAVIESGAFEGLQNLKRLDLSENLIRAVNSNIFSGLPTLGKLFLSGNQIATIPDGTFNDLRLLKRIEFNSPVLQCDCYLKKVLKWSQMRNVKITGTVCAFPKKMRGRAVGNLRRRELVCNRKFQLKVFHIRPSKSQLVFQGDKLPFECYASKAPGLMQIAWYRSGHLVTTNASRGVSVNTTHNTDRTILNHRLVVEKLDSSHAGKWSCVVTTQAGNHTKTVTVDVRMPEVVLECPAVQNRTAKGLFRWEQSVAGLVATQPCHKAKQQGAMASHTCGREGYWTALNISACDFTKDITRKLSGFSTADIANIDVPTLTYGVRKALVTASQKREVMDSFDVFYVTKIMATLLPYSFDNAEVATLLVNMVSNVSSLSPNVLNSAQIETRSPARMVTMLEEMGQEMQPQPQPEGLYSQPVDTKTPEPLHAGLWSGVSQNVLMVVIDQEKALSTGVSCSLEEDRIVLTQQGKAEAERQDDGEDLKKTNFDGSRFVCGYDGSYTDGTLFVRIPAISRKPLQEEDHSSAVDVDSSGKEDVIVLDIDNTNSTVISGLNNDSSEVNNSSSGSSLSAYLQDDPLPLTDASSSSSSSKLSSSVDNEDLPLLAPESLSFPTTKDQLAALNISSKYFSKFPSTLNLSSPNLDKTALSSFLPKSGFPFSSRPVVLGKLPERQRRKNLHMLVYSTGHLFPVLHTELGDPAFRQGNWTVITPVIGVFLGDQSLSPQNLSEPIAFTFKISDPRRPLKAAFFDFAFI
ncbi:adhesion g protein-coupled receptor a3, partial [Plakobranchus ocellatus]